MIDRVARAINPNAFEAGDADQMHVARVKAEAAIAAMREPTPAMVKAAVWALDNWRADNGDLWAKPPDKHQIRWRAMVDAALKESS